MFYVWISGAFLLGLVLGGFIVQKAKDAKIARMRTEFRTALANARPEEAGSVVERIFSKFGFGR